MKIIRHKEKKCQQYKIPDGMSHVTDHVVVFVVEKEYKSEEASRC